MLMSFDPPPPAIAALQLRISLSGLSPPVWRRVLVPEHLTLGQLHNVIQVVMGWADEHPHTFSIRGRRYGEAHEGVLQFSTAANELPLTAFRLREHEGFVYVSDFNAWWRHEIRVERRRLRQHPGGLPGAATSEKAEGRYAPTRKCSADCPALTARCSQAGISPCPSHFCPSASR
ncbi:plasmid pRiA4b ORF-3 family protein [Cupriavidus sp. PET2-C1]